MLASPAGVFARAAGSQDAAGRAPSFEAWCESSGACRVRLSISSHLLHSLGLDGSFASDAARRQACLSAFERYHGRAASAWPMAVAGGYGGTNFACALHGFDLAAARHSAGRHGIEIARAVPLWASALRAAAASAPALLGAEKAMLVLIEDGLATCLDLRGGALVGVQHRYLEEARAAALAELLARLAAETSLPQPLTFAMGWGLTDDDVAPATARGWHSIGRLDGHAADAAWLFEAH